MTFPPYRIDKAATHIYIYMNQYSGLFNIRSYGNSAMLAQYNLLGLVVYNRFHCFNSFHYCFSIGMDSISHSSVESKPSQYNRISITYTIPQKPIVVVVVVLCVCVKSTQYPLVRTIRFLYVL